MDECDLEREVIYNYHTNRYHTSEDCAGKSEHTITTKLGGVQYHGAISCTRCGAKDLR